MSEDQPGARPDLREAKRVLRERVLHARDALPPDTRARFVEAIVATLAAREDFRLARTVMLSLAFRSEWETRPLLARARSLGKRVVAPRVDRQTRMLALCAVDDLERDVGPGYFGIDEPLPHCEKVDLSAIDWVLVPGV